MTDILSDIFETIRLRGTLYFRTDYAPPWAVTVPAYEQAARFHLIVQGRCHVEITGGGPGADLGPGDLMLITGGREHILSDCAGREPAPLEEIVRRSGYDGKGVFAYGTAEPGAATQMVCGHLNFTRGADHPLLRALPPLIVMRPAERAMHPLLDDTLRLVVRRAFTDTLGAAASISRLSEVFFIETVRASIDAHTELSRVIAAMTDAQVGRALSSIHEAPADPWTVESLAQVAGMSRSRFAERFTELVGVAPMAYVAEWRMQKALARLVESDANVKVVAAEVGYQSAAAFTRAFVNRFGVTPTEAGG
ncbi:MAG: AraC family transcriptional regulator [Hyphomicrobium sp.]